MKNEKQTPGSTIPKPVYGVAKKGYGGYDTKNKPESAGKDGKVPGQ